MRRVTAICETGEGATRALKALVEASFPSGDITVLRVSGRQVNEPPIGHRTRIPTTLPIGIAGRVTQYTTYWGEISAAGFMACIPIMIFAFIVQKHLVRGLSFGAVKG